MATNKQEKMLQNAIDIIEHFYAANVGRAWGNLFEEGENNTNYVIIGLLNEIENRPNFAAHCLENGNKQYLPDKVVKLARLYAEEGEEEEPPIYEKVRDFLNKLDNMALFNEKLDDEKMEYLERYYIEPMRQEV